MSRLVAFAAIQGGYKVVSQVEGDLEKANNQLNEILKDLSLGLMALVPFAPLTIPMIAKFAKKHNIDLLPEWFKDSLK